MKIIYRANDGKEFQNKEECVNYERTMLSDGFVMYGTDGKTEDFEKCWVINIKKDNQNIFKCLENLCRLEGCSSEGFAIGLNIYDIITEQWINLDDDILLALEQYFKNRELEN